jgi:iron complex outermembrane receptor protein
VTQSLSATLFGRNVTGGAIVINTRQPNVEAREFDTQLTVGNYGDSQLNGLVNIPIDDGSAIKLTTSLHDRNGYGHDRLPGKDEDDINSRNYRGQYYLRRGAVEVTLSADYIQDWNGGRTLSSDTLGDDGNARTSELGAPQNFAGSVALAIAEMPFG